MPDPALIAAWIAVIVALGGAFGAAVKFILWVLDEWGKRKAHPGFHVPRKSLHITTGVERDCWWHMGRLVDAPIMQVVGEVLLTNVCPVPILAVKVEIRYGWLGRKRLSGTATTSSAFPRGGMYGLNAIPPNETRDFHFNFWVPPVREVGQAFKAKSVRIFDQFGNSHSFGPVVFKSDNPEPNRLANGPEERAYQITNAVEKQVVSVLQAERSRYKVNGRATGGLGSVHLVYRGTAMQSIPGDSWTTNSPENHLLVADPESAELRSENILALVEYYKTLSDEQDRVSFRAALLDRLDPKRGYADVAYLIIAVFASIDLLPAALEKAVASLPQPDHTTFGLSNVLLLLNGLLRYRHHSFSSELIDHMERTLHGIEEHTFMIPEKLAMIRARRGPERSIAPTRNTSPL